MNHHIKPLMLATAAVMLSACASTGTQLSANQADAQTALADAIKGQLKSSFSYETQIHVNNHLREEALAAASPSQLAAVDDKMQLCEETHDAAYIAWLKQLKAEGVDIKALDTDKYADKLATFKDSYTACVNERSAQLTQAEASGDAAAFENLSPEMQKLYAPPAADDAAQMDANTAEPLFADRSSHNNADNANYLPDYDSDHTALDAKKSALLKAYLIQPASITISGRYQPLAGQFTALPALGYDAKNLQAHINQPIHLDLKAGVLYLWADNFAMVNSETLDKTLGDKWRNKWLAIPINDGSLPADFTERLIKSYIKAKQQSFLSLDKSGFSYVNADAVLGLPHLTDNLSDSAKQAITKSPSIIRDSSSADAQAFARYVFADTLYDELAAAYPELLPEPIIGDDKAIIEGESEIHVVNLAKDKPSADSAPTAVQINSRFLVQLMMGMLSVISADYQSTIAMTASQPDLADQFATPASYAPISHYGISANHVSWIHQRQYASSLLPFGLGKSSVREAQPLLIDKFTMILPLSRDGFDRLPADARIPNTTNTINLPDYARDLVTRLQSGDDKYLQMMLALLGGSVIGNQGMQDAPSDAPDEIPLDTPPSPSGQ